MSAALLIGHGGLDKLEYRTDVPVPEPADDEVLIEVGAAGVNNTDINTRLGWYSKAVDEATNVGGAEGFQDVSDDDAGWSGTALEFPRIQGADVAGRIVAVGANIAEARLGERVMVRNMLRHYVNRRPYESWTLGSECDGGFAQYVAIASDETHAVNSQWSDIDLAAVPCAYSTAENMLHRAKVGAERVLITGASGGVGMAAIQLARRRGAEVIGVSSAAKAQTVYDAGAHRVIDRAENPVDTLGDKSVDVVLDVVGGTGVADLLTVLRLGGRYAVAGAIGGPLAQIDLRTVYLKDLSLLGCTFQEDEVFTNLVGYVERNEIKPLVSQTYELEDIQKAQQDFIDKIYPGKLVLLPPPVTGK
ncbi:MAG TPA: alcohol dehydrogenase family protein [Candidatus Yaniella excrementigallinarum]|nr:alcohol dehydrogenase family protein [Candidatus Yaniella excrementigallinarum]